METRSFRFLHAADIHLDSPLRGLERYEGAPAAELRGATREAFEALVRLAIDEEVAFVLIAGDLYDGDWEDYSTGLYLIRQLAALRKAGIRVYLVAGNHDAQSKISRHLTLPENTVRFKHTAPHTELLPELGVAIHGQSYAQQKVVRDLSADYPPPVRGLLNIGILHTALDGSRGHDPYAPCSVEALKNKGYDYWALGHVHAREIVHEEPWIVFPGNLQGRHVREGGAKGATLVTVEDKRIVGVEHRVLDVLRWAELSVDLEGATHLDAALARARAALEGEVARAEGRLLAARIVLTGATDAHSELASRWAQVVGELRAAAVDLGAVWVEDVRLRTRPRVDLDALSQRDDALGSLLRGFTDEVDVALSDALLTELEPLTSRLPPELRERLPALGGAGEADFAELWQGARQLVIAHLLSGEDPA